MSHTSDHRSTPRFAAGLALAALAVTMLLATDVTIAAPITMLVAGIILIAISRREGTRTRSTWPPGGSDGDRLDRSAEERRALASSLRRVEARVVLEGAQTGSEHDDEDDDDRGTGGQPTGRAAEGEVVDRPG